MFFQKTKKPAPEFRQEKYKGKYIGMVLYGGKKGEIYAIDEPELLMNDGTTLAHRLDRIWAPHEWTLDDILVELMKRYEPNGGIAADYED